MHYCRIASQANYRCFSEASHIQEGKYYPKHGLFLRRDRSLSVDHGGTAEMIASIQVLLGFLADVRIQMCKIDFTGHLKTHQILPQSIEAHQSVITETSNLD